MLENYPVGSITENGVEVPIFVDDDGTWKADHEGRQLRFATREKLRDAIKKLTKRTTGRIDLPFTRILKSEDGIKFWRGTATGLHSGNGNVLYTRTLRGAKVKEQFSTYGNINTAVTFGAVTDDVLGKLHQLVKEEAAARNALRTFEDEHKIDLKSVVTEALDKAE